MQPLRKTVWRFLKKKKERKKLEQLNDTATPFLGESESESQGRSLTPWTIQLYSPWNSPGQNTGVGSLSLLQGIFRTQGLNPYLPHCRQILYQLSHKRSPFPGIYMGKNKTLIQKDTCTPMFIAALFTIAKIWKQSTSISRQMDKRLLGEISVYTHTHIMEYYSAIERMKFSHLQYRWAQVLVHCRLILYHLNHQGSLRDYYA